MGDQRHRIKRQILEVHVPHSDQAQHLYSELRHIYDTRLVPAIDQYCSELSHPDRIHQIDLIELDLGHLDIGNLESDLVAKVCLQLKEKLSEQIKEQEAQTAARGKDPKTVSRLECLDVFAQTGSLPWWADYRDRSLLKTVLYESINESPNDLIRLARGWVGDTRPLQRIVSHYDDESLSALCTLIMPSAGAHLLAVARDLGVLLSHSSNGAHSDRSVRNALWAEILRSAFSKDRTIQDETDFWGEVITRAASHFDLSASELDAALRECLRTALLTSDQISSGAHLVKIVEAFCQMNQKREPRVSTPEYEAIRRILGRFIQAGDFLADLAVPLRQMVHQLQPRVHETVLATLTSLDLGTIGIEQERRKIKDALRNLFLSLQSTKGISEWPLRHCIALLDDDASQNTSGLKRRDDDEQYIENSGLVILWPFLGRLFQHLGLTEKDQFKHTAAVHRAVAILQNLAAEESDPPEYDLTLNRILCGMDLSIVFDLDPPLSEHEAVECNNLLRAVIDQVPILKNMSISGFRGSFLLREGVLSVRDGIFLLRVERSSFDVVLDRFPWIFAWVKFPWMPSPLQVEW